ncbi:hypothetical protein BT69DRAFT_1349644 [Atractiella rhizophila]|nr:hypothetical protein BT69DRAFT_1349644 [Atractiella rhizophila]
MRRVRRRVTPADDIIQFASSSQTMTEEQTAGLCNGSQEPNSRAFVHVITLSDEPDSIHLSILPSFLSCLPSSTHLVRISFANSRGIWPWELAKMKFSYLSLERVENVVDKDGAINLHITINWDHVSVTFLDVEEYASTVERDVKSEFDQLAPYGNSYTRTFPFFRENAIFAPIASYSEFEGRFLPTGKDESSSPPSLLTDIIIQLSVPPPDVIPCTISCLPIELLSLIFSFYHGDASILSEVCQLWSDVSVPYWCEPDSVVEKYERLKRYLGAGRLWDRLLLEESIDVGRVKEVIAGSPNVTEVVMYACWGEEEAKIVLNAIEGLKRVNDVRFRRGSRKWRKEEIENFVQRMGDRITWLQVYGVEDSPASASEGLHLSSHLEWLKLDEYPPLPSLSLPRTLKFLALSNMCPLPSCISEYPLPPLLEYLRIELVPFSADGKTSVLPTPLDLSHLTCLTELILDGGEETSNLVSPPFFSSLMNATGIELIILQYCVVDSSDFPDFIRWFFGDWRVRGAKKRDRVNGKAIGRDLEVRLFFGEWSKEEIVIARSTMRKYESYGSGVWEPGEGEE